MKKILVTGNAGFIGFHVAKRLMKMRYHVIGFDDVNAYYDQKLKKARLDILRKTAKKYKVKYHFIKRNLSDEKAVKKCFAKNKFDTVIHLAAQAGVRYSVYKPINYLKSNIIGFFNILECSRKYKIRHLIFGSSSSVYGSQKKYPVSEKNNTDLPLSFYAATKKSNEVMAHSYSNIYKLPCTGLRFFTVYGPFGRPDMALFKFTQQILKGKKIKLFNKGNHIRDFTFIDDAVSGILSVLKKAPKGKIPFSIFNVASSNPKNIKLFLHFLERELNKKARIQLAELQKGDVEKTYANNKKLFKKTGFKPKIQIKVGIQKFVDWYLNYFNKN
tara:strand:- start:145 stop:1131 length:987 start_codon:yes stop_codon:yes gene_type:complete